VDHFKKYSKGQLGQNVKGEMEFSGMNEHVGQISPDLGTLARVKD